MILDLVPNAIKEGSLTATYSRKTCSFSLVCLTDTELVEIAFDRLLQELDSDLELSGQMVRYLLEFAMKKERREYEFLCLTAEERYDLLCQRSPDLVRQVTQNEIARYLGITPVALSRIRGRKARRS